VEGLKEAEAELLVVGEPVTDAVTVTDLLILADAVTDAVRLGVLDGVGLGLTSTNSTRAAMPEATIEKSVLKTTVSAWPVEKTGPGTVEPLIRKSCVPAVPIPSYTVKKSQHGSVSVL
jgi:hypothetical protein